MNRFDPGSDGVFQAPNTLAMTQGTTFAAGAEVTDFGVGDTIALTGYQDGSFAQYIYGSDGVRHLINPEISFDYAGGILSVLQSGTTIASGMTTVVSDITIAAIPLGAGYVPSGFTATPLAGLAGGLQPPLLVNGYAITYAPPGVPAPSLPVISGTQANQPTTDLTAIDPFSNVSITDVNTGAVDTAVVTMTGTVPIGEINYVGAYATGTLSNLGIGTLIENGAGYMVTGTPAKVQAALDGLVFTPVAHQTGPGQTVTTGFTIALNDQFGSVTDGTTSVAAKAVDDPLLLSGVTPLLYVSNNINAAQPFRNIALSDPDNATFTATATLASTEYIAFSKSFGSTISASGIWSTSGSLAAVTEALHGLVAYVSSEPPLPTGQFATTTMSMSINDGASDTVTATSTIDIVSSSTVNATGLQIIGATPGQMVADQTPIAACNVVITDTQVGSPDTVTVTMSNPADGTFSDALGGTINGGTFTVSGTPLSSDFGFVSEVNNLLDALIFTPTRGQVPPGDSVTTWFTITASNTLGSVTDASASVIATDEGGQLSIGGTQANQELTDNTTALPLAGVTITDTQLPPVDTATVTLSNPASGVLTAGNGGTIGADGVFGITGPLDQVQAALRAIGFTPAGLVTGQMATSGVTISVADGTLHATDTTTSLDVIGIGAASETGTAPASFTGTLANLGVVDETPLTPFSGLTVTDTGTGDTDTVAITLANRAFGTLSNLGSGSYNGTSGVYSIAGAPDAVTTAIDGLQVAPTTPAANVFLTSTAVAASVAGPGGGPAPQNAVDASVQQVLGLASVPVGNIAISVSADGTGLAAPDASDTNEAAVTSPTLGGIYTLPTGYQAEYLGGNANATLQDTDVGNAVLVGNSGNDTLIAGASNDSIVAGNGNNTLQGGSGTVALVVGDGNDSITTSAASTDAVTLGGGTDTVFASGSGTITGGTGSDLIDASGTGQSASDRIVSQGQHSSVLGGAGELTVLEAGAHDTIQAGSGATTVTVDGSTGRTRGGTGSIAGSTLVNGSSSALAVNFIGGASNSTVLGGPGATTIFGTNGTDVGFVGSVTGGLLYANGTSVGGETLSAGGSTTNDTLFAAQGNVSLVAGSGSDFLDAGANTGSLGGAGTVVGGDTMVGGSGADFMLFSHGAFEGAAVVINFTSADTVLLAGYNAAAGRDQASMALANATVAGGNTTIALVDGTTITFVDATAAQLQGHLLSS